MAETFNLGDKVTHDFSGGEGTVVGLRARKPYTVRVRWGGEKSLNKEWYKPEVLLPREEKVSQFFVDKDNNDDEHFFLDVAGKGTVMIVSNDTGVSVDIFPAQVADKPIASMYVLNEDFNEDVEAS